MSNKGVRGLRMMNAYGRVLSVLLILILLVVFGAVGTAEEMVEKTIELKGYENNGEYQYVELGYYPYTSTGSEQPILWRVLSANGDMALLRSEYALEAVTGNKYSSIDDILSDITGKALGTLLEHGAITTSSVPSVSDLNSSYYGYAKEGVNESRKVEATPYAAAHGVLMENGYAGYWTYNGNKISYVTPNGGIIPVNRTMLLGVVPMITASISELRLNEGSGTKNDPFRSTYSQRNIWFEHNMKIHFFEDERHIHNPNRKRIDVYTGPGEDYYLVKGSSINKHGTTIKVLAREGSWLLIEYMVTGSGYENKSYCYKTGWVYEPAALENEDLKVFTGERWETVPTKEYDSKAIPRKMVDVYVTKDAMMYDDRNLKSQPIYVLETGREARLLGYTEHNDILLGYVEADIYDQKARGFVLLECLEAEDYDIGFMTVK